MNHQESLHDESLPDVTIPADLVIKSIGLKTVPLEGLSYDIDKHIIPNEFGCVIDESG